VLSEVQDGRALSYDDATFDAAFCVSVLEHIPDEGDSLTIRELVRVVKPGGLVIFTTPYALEHRDTFVKQTVYDRQFEGRPIFFERHYDARTLKTRLLDASSATVMNAEIWGEGFIRGEALLASIGPLRAVVSPLEAPLARLCLKHEITGRKIHPMAAFITLQRPSRASGI
jgi:SAM-dependent methyltransferase